ncbi:MAG: hypothetical protein GEV10_13315 [Streptosporangiales bacterium]|nr:hypothetical protein [Streptosporangiales bacterium]
MRWSRGSRGGRGVAAAFGLAVVGFVLAGCTGLPTAEPSEGASQGSKSKAPGKAMTFDLVADQGGTVTVDVPAEPIASAPTSTEGLTIELYAVQRSDNVVNVVVAAHNTGKTTIPLQDVTTNLDESPSALEHDASNIALLDAKGLKEYRTFREDGEDGPCLCSKTHDIGDNEEDDFAPGERRHYVSQVAAPPADVTKVTVLAGLGSFPDVTIEG